jgi:hypothetical protein
MRAMTLRIIGAGLGRTGTLSLKLALEQLGAGPCYHMMEVAVHPEHSALWLAADRGEPIDWQRIFAGYTSAVDWPACAFWRELLAAYPEARAILSLRDSASWYASFRETILARVESLPPLASPAMRALYELGNEIILRRTFGGSAADMPRAVEVFEAHNSAVIAAVEPGRLLVFDVADGWEPLCRFLDVPVPAGEFPRVNPRTEFSSGLRARVGGPGRKLKPKRL